MQMGCHYLECRDIICPVLSSQNGQNLNYFMGNFLSKSKRKPHFLVTGLKGAGKTTILYKLKLGEVVTQIPSIGFGVEQLDYSNIYSFSVWDIGKAEDNKMMNIDLKTCDGIVFVVDSTDKQRLSKEFIHNNKLILLTHGYIKHHMQWVNNTVIINEDHEFHHSEIIFPSSLCDIIFTYIKILENDFNYEYHGNFYANEELRISTLNQDLSGVPILILANKQDLPTALLVSEVIEILKLEEIKDRDWYIQSSCATTGDGLYEGLDWLDNSPKKGKKSNKWMA